MSSVYQPALGRTLSATETWVLSFAPLTYWLLILPFIYHDLGESGIWVVLAATISGLVYTQVLRPLAAQHLDLPGGTPSYLTQIFRRCRPIAYWLGLSYYIASISAVPIGIQLLTQSLQHHLLLSGIDWSIPAIQLGLLGIVFAAAFSGQRALSILLPCMMVPALLFLVGLCVGGIGWLTLSPQSPGLALDHLPAFHFVDWAKYYIIAIGGTYATDSCTPILAESRQPHLTLRSMQWAAWLMPGVWLSAFWLILRLHDPTMPIDDVMSYMLPLVKPVFGDQWGLILLSFAGAAGSLASCVMFLLCGPRILFQLAQDGYAPPVFRFLSYRGILTPAILLQLGVTGLLLLVGAPNELNFLMTLMWLPSAGAILGGGWHCLRATAPRLANAALLLLGINLISCGAGLLAWGWWIVIVSWVMPILIQGLLAGMRRCPLALFRLEWWVRRDRTARQRQLLNLRQQDFVLTQILTLIILLCLALLMGILVGQLFQRGLTLSAQYLSAVLAILTAFVGVVMAGWISLPQVLTLDAARQVAEDNVRQRQTVEDALRAQTEELAIALERVQKTQMLVQTEKMAGLSRMVAGVAHEINNPTAFIVGNVEHARGYTQDLVELIALYQSSGVQTGIQTDPAIQAKIEAIDLEYIIQDLPKLFQSMETGTARIHTIVASLRNFSRLDEAAFKWADLAEGMQSTLLLVNHRLNATWPRSPIHLDCQFEPIPQLECYAGQINQVFLNILNNAIDALEADVDNLTPTIRIQIKPHKNMIRVAISNNGPEIPASIQAQLFDPFFTTKPVGKGTGLGLSISYDIIVHQHQGKLWCESGNDSPGDNQAEQRVHFILELPGDRQNH
jgi:signal transduction histidine kinase